MLDNTQISQIRNLAENTDRLVISDDIYKSDEFKSYSLRISDTRENSFSLFYSDADIKEKDLIDILSERRSPYMLSLVEILVRDINEVLALENIALTEEEEKELVSLNKPVIMVTKKKEDTNE
ncbi:MAG TPA: hypothetical protein IAB12_02355 [Candidatus Ornithospirochaeta avicola]|uniref:Uncharacterized protein n=1 Tax=Candidatus Ornithospirochaeta avicola TaxID=2840896 RepID=A0A9D1PU18_9SPIO|nr:hypothetical protein [Candidatus Ornithospirochaeta avicola]